MMKDVNSEMGTTAMPMQPAEAAGSGASNHAEIEIFRNKVTGLLRGGYELLHTEEFENDSPSAASAFKTLRADGRGISAAFGTFDSRQTSPTKIEGVGTEGLGFMEWGPSNNLPNLIYNFAASLPYTAAALRYLSDLALGYGPKLMYHFIPCTGAPAEDIEFGDAGKRILAEILAIRSTMDQMAAEGSEGDDGDGDDGDGEGGNGEGNNPLAAPALHTMGGEEDDKKDEIGTLPYFLKRYQEDYKIWEKTNEEYQRFIKYNDLNYHYLNCTIDDMHLDIYFPTIGLSIGKRGEEWNPKIMKVGYLPAACCRLEAKDKWQRINHVFYNELWRNGNQSGATANSQNTVDYPALMQEDFMSRLEKTVEKNRKTKVGSRPTWFCCPCIYPSSHKPYYPQPAWWSIFPTQTYDYATTLITDKAIARKNATMWGKMIFINLEYLRQLFDDAGADTPEEKMEIRKKILGEVNAFLRRKENNGKSICLDMYPSTDGKTMLKAIEIVDVPQLNQGKDMKDELEEVSSIIFFAIGVHPALIGAIPGAKSSSGGTFQRELHLLKQTQMSSRQRIYLRFLDNIATFNKWDAHGRWQIAMPVLTTLDRNKTGIEEM